jgi:putative flavoprotein involved in K+ transport
MDGRLFAGDPLVGIRTADLQLPTLRRVGRTVDVVDGLPVIENHGGPNVSAVIWCTGFRPAFDWIKLPVFERNGYPRHRRGLVAEAPGLAFLGLRYQHRMSSSLLGGVGEDAAFVVSSLQRDVGAASV